MPWCLRCVLHVQVHVAHVLMANVDDNVPAFVRFLKSLVRWTDHDADEVCNQALLLSLDAPGSNAGAANCTQPATVSMDQISVLLGTEMNLCEIGLHATERITAKKVDVSKQGRRFLSRIAGLEALMR